MCVSFLNICQDWSSIMIMHHTSVRLTRLFIQKIDCVVLCFLNKTILPESKTSFYSLNRRQLKWNGEAAVSCGILMISYGKPEFQLTHAIWPKISTEKCGPYL